MLRQRWIVLAAWLTVLLLLAAWNALNLRLGTDLSQFLPRGASQQDQVLLSQVRGGIAARTLLLRISGAQPSADLADASRALAAALRNEEGFFQIANGETTLDASATDAALFNHRYLIGPPRDCADALTEAGLRSALQERLGELASGMAMLDKQRLAADPTACYRQLLRALVPQRTPNRQHGVWFSPDGRHALLVVITAAQASDLAAQRLAIGRSSEHVRFIAPKRWSVAGTRRPRLLCDQLRATDQDRNNAAQHCCKHRRCLDPGIRFPLHVPRAVGHAAVAERNHARRRCRHLAVWLRARHHVGPRYHAARRRTGLSRACLRPCRRQPVTADQYRLAHPPAGYGHDCTRLRRPGLDQLRGAIPAWHLRGGRIGNGRAHVALFAASA